MANFTVLFDACVLYPAPLRDLLLNLAMTELFRARWSDAIHEEWISNLLRNRTDLTASALARTRALMNAAVPDCLVRGYEPLIAGLSLPDANDRHVLAAAIVAKAGAIVTFNLKDFPADALEPYGIEAQHPDDFIRHLLDLAPCSVCNAIHQYRIRLKRPSKTVEDYLDTLAQQSLPQTVAELHHMAELL
jgi:hypothetical protein